MCLRHGATLLFGLACLVSLLRYGHVLAAEPLEGRESFNRRGRSFHSQVLSQVLEAFGSRLTMVGSDRDREPICECAIADSMMHHAP